MIWKRFADWLTRRRGTTEAAVQHSRERMRAAAHIAEQSRIEGDVTLAHVGERVRRVNLVYDRLVAPQERTEGNAHGY